MDIVKKTLDALEVLEAEGITVQQAGMTQTSRDCM